LSGRVERRAELGGEGDERGAVSGQGFEVLFEFAGEARAFVEAEHAEGSGQLVGGGGGFFAQRWRQRAGDGVVCGAVEQGETLQDLRLIALPEGGDQLLRRRLCGRCHRFGYRRDSKLFACKTSQVGGSL